MARARLPVIVLVLLLLMGGCTGLRAPVPTQGPPSVVASATGRLAAVRELVGSLTASAQARDEAGFMRLLSARDPSFADRGRLLYTNLSALPLQSLAIRVESAEVPLNAERAKVVGVDAWSQRAVVRWRVAGDDGTAEGIVWLTFSVEAGAVRLAGTIDQPSTAGPVQQPIWWLGPAHARQSGSATVIAGPGQPIERWASAAERAAAAVRRQLPPRLATDWSGRVVVEAPATMRDFETVLGKRAGSYGEIAAVTQRAGTGSDAALRIVVSPRAAQIKPKGRLDALLEHETVHLATRSPDSPGPLWAEEGLAEWVAWGANPQLAVDGTAALFARVRATGPPSTLPADRAFEPGAGDLSEAYAASWLACRFIAEKFGTDGLARLYAALEAGRSLDEASRQVLGLDSAELTAGWSRDVAARAKEG